MVTCLLVKEVRDSTRGVAGGRARSSGDPARKAPYSAGSWKIRWTGARGGGSRPIPDRAGRGVRTRAPRSALPRARRGPGKAPGAGLGMAGSVTGTGRRRVPCLRWREGQAPGSGVARRAGAGEGIGSPAGSAAPRGDLRPGALEADLRVGGRDGAITLWEPTGGAGIRQSEKPPRWRTAAPAEASESRSCVSAAGAAAERRRPVTTGAHTGGTHGTRSGPPPRPGRVLSAGL